MAEAGAEVLSESDPLAKARLHTSLRFAVGTTAAFVLSETLGWYPTFLAPLLAATLIGNLPVPLSPRAGLALILVQGGASLVAFLLASVFLDTPFIDFCAVALVVFLCFVVIAQGRAFLPMLLILVDFAVVPVVTLVAPQQAGALPLAFLRSTVLAVGLIWLVQVLWPEFAKAAAPAPAAHSASPKVRALVGTVIVLPVMLVYMMYGITDALPVLITTIVVVTSFDPGRGAAQGAAMVAGNLVGGAAAILAYMLLQVDPSLATLGLVALLVGIAFGSRIARGGPAAGVAVVTFNQTMVLWSLALVPGGAAPGLWMIRVLQFALAGLFAVSMLMLLLPRNRPGAGEAS